MTDSTTRWNRLSPTARNGTMRKGLRALLADPLWLLGRQWQVGELTGEDAGSPVSVELWFDHDPMTAVDHAPEDGSVTPEAYNPKTDGPLEALVEREPVVSGDRQPNREIAVEAGRYFLARLDEEEFEVDGHAPRASDFDADLQLAPPERELDSEGERYVTVVEGRSLDGCALFDRLTGSGILAAEDWQAVNWGSVDEPTVGGSDPFRRAAKAFVDWYADLYDEPTGEAEYTWNADRMEYEFAAATGSKAAGTETVFSAEEYTGGRLDWDAFSVVQDGTESLTEAVNTSSDHVPDIAFAGGSAGAGGSLPADQLSVSRDRPEPDMTILPTKVTFPGMPSSRWWEMEDGEVNIGNIEVGPGELGKILLTEHATMYGNDWFSIPVEAPVGSLTRITEMLVTDTFGQVTRVEPAVHNDLDTGEDSEDTATSTESVEVSDEAAESSLAGALAGSDGWNMFMHTGLPNHRRPGLLLAPVLGTHHESDPVERVVLARDEMANMAFGIELVTEDAIGDPLEWTEFTLPALAVDTVRASPDPGEERIRFQNTGESPIDVGGWTVANDGGDSYTFPEGTVVGPDEYLTLYSGLGNDAEPSALYWDRTSTPVWEGSDEVTVTDADGEIAVQQFIGDPANPSLPDYRLVTDVHDYWFPMKMLPTGERAPGEFAIGDLRFDLARLLDTDLDTHAPAGKVLEEDLLLHDEELTRAGVEVTRTYQYARWLDGSTHLWAGRRAGPGRGEGASGLQYDIVVEPDAADASEVPPDDEESP